MRLLKGLNDKDGFSLIEVIIVIAIGALILTATFNVFSSSIKSFFFTDEKSATQREIRFLTSYVAENIRNSSVIKFTADYNTTLETGEAIIGYENTELRYREAGSTGRTVLKFTQEPSILFSIDLSGVLNSIIIQVDDKQKEIILNNFKTNSISPTQGSYIIFVK